MVSMFVSAQNVQTKSTGRFKLRELRWSVLEQIAVRGEDANAVYVPLSPLTPSGFKTVNT